MIYEKIVRLMSNFINNLILVLDFFYDYININGKNYAI